MASIKDVAERAGVSTTTVSRVLSNPAAVRTPLRERVEQAIAVLAYRPNLAARRLRQQRASLVGLIVSDIRSPFFTDVGRAVEDVAYRHGLRLILCNTDEDPAKEQSYLELMADEQASGVILSPTMEGLKRLRPTDWPFPMVLVDRALDTTRADRVVLDNRAAARRATEHLLDAGYRRIAVLAGTHSTTGQERQAGYADALRERGLAPDPHWVAPTREAGMAAATALLAGTGGMPRPDALLATNGLLLLGAVHAIQAAGLSMPNDIGLAGFDNNDWTALPALDVTVIAQPTYDIGRTAAELLLQRLAEPERTVRRVVLEGALLARGSTRRG
ncbi:LacI family DNA-binding transcriptional regulator [Acidovorax sp. SUPP2539]|uniref:LacI family DNA-binding transcriptional regulator n=1 Tax=Acidovorax sp. SUPP2539 TaxID=2920878 RepID=UPI0023DE3F0A|nr:LacI family DNA-binding transcriptional regulator [Acidovorax sp. SUPP2539]GKS87721.1 LacI family transcriptional regulator [Acidovorax sp. SUPP2539]